MITTAHNIKVCEWCWREFDSGYHKEQRFCCYECSNQARIKYKDIQCEYCWKIFHPDNADRKYCSRECAYLWNTMNDKLCPICWEYFHPRKTQKYCSKKCYWKAQTLQDISCPICWKIFKPKTKTTKYCSAKCRSLWHRLSSEDVEKKNKKNEAICPQCNNTFVKKRKHQIYCSKKCALKSRGSISKKNIQFKKLLEYLWYEVETEFYLWWYYYDFKIWNTLVELNPFAYHNSTMVPPKPGARPKSRLYHYNKYINAINNWYKCVMVWDRTSNLIPMLNDEWFHYEWLPQLHYYNPSTNEHFIGDEDKSLIDEWFVEIWDCGKETFSNIIHQDASNK